MRKAVLAAFAFALLGTGAGAQTTPQPGARATTPQPGAHVMHLIKLPNGDYSVPLSELQGSGTSGNVTLHPEGMKTIFTVQVSGKPKHKHAFSLHSGSDCSILRAPNNIALAPARTGQASRTIVSLPISSLTSRDYSIVARDASSRAQFQEACARL